MERLRKIITSKDMEPEEERIVDMTAINILANHNPRIPDSSLTTLADTVEKCCRDFYHAIRANGIKHVRVSVDRGATSGKIVEVFQDEVKEKRFMAVAGLLTLNIYPYLDAEYVAKWYGFQSQSHMALIVPELCRHDGHFNFKRGELAIRDIIKIFNK